MSKGVVIITGSAQGIGRAIALRLASDGYDIAVNDIAPQKEHLESLKSEIESKRRKSIVVIADVSKEEEVQKMVDTTVKELGGLDVMVANAGIVHFKPLIQTSVADWDRLFAVNTRGLMLCYQTAAKQMIAQGRGGRIIGACSMAGKKAFPAYAAYSATKFAVRAITQSAAAELGRYKITVNAYCPGNIETPMSKYISVSSPTCKLLSTPRIVHNMIPIIAESTGADLETPEDVASLVSYLASPDSHFITGQRGSFDRCQQRLTFMHSIIGQSVS
ncbi:acetoin reductase [Moniliophthora roreri MCA 2997]|uniref:Acetoin reductase n=1 Tax=Moniliophthora roreri (strain MCA 2997) TaxID=1381753 RepID=V2WVZ1_MONRO|nr:acetoin reductase [Moniliophthora roreri MCA 2997]